MMACAEKEGEYKTVGRNMDLEETFSELRQYEQNEEERSRGKATSQILQPPENQWSSIPREAFF